MTKLDVAWFGRWHRELDDALACLPELGTCSRETYRELMVSGTEGGKWTALVSRGDAPVAVIILRRRSRLTWEPALQWLVPGDTFPVLPGLSVAALRALGLTVNVSRWRVHDPLPTGRDVRLLHSMPIHRLSLKGGFEDHWRQTHYLHTITRMRRRFERLQCRVNEEGSAAWAIANWNMRWRSESDVMLRDRIMVTRAMEGAGLHRTVGLFDGDRLVAGATGFVHGSDLVAGVNHCLPEYHAKGVGVRLIDQVVADAAQHGLDGFDMGGGYDYKKKWAPQNGVRTSFVLAPEMRWQVQRAASMLRDLVRRRGAPADAGAAGG